MIKFYFVGIMILVLFCAGSCGLGTKNSRGPLSEAMEKASDDYEGERTVEVERADHDNEADIFISYPTSDSSVTTRNSEFHADTASVKNQDSYIGILVGSGFIGDDYFDRLNQVFVYYGFSGDRVNMNILGGYAWAPVNSESSINKSIDSPLQMLKIGFVINYYTTPKWTFIGNKLVAGMNFGAGYWSYKNPIEVIGENSTETITSDIIGQFELYIGSGINITQTELFNLGFYVHAGVLLYNDETSEGFENDIFSPSGYLKFGASVEIK